MHIVIKRPLGPYLAIKQGMHREDMSKSNICAKNTAKQRRVSTTAVAAYRPTQHTAHSCLSAALLDDYGRHCMCTGRSRVTKLGLLLCKDSIHPQLHLYAYGGGSRRKYGSIILACTDFALGPSNKLLRVFDMSNSWPRSVYSNERHLLRNV